MAADEGAWIERLADALMRRPRAEALERVPELVRGRIASAFMVAPAHEALALVYDAQLGVEARRRRGVHYTPTVLADRVISAALAVTPSRPATVLDPAMGAGSLLCAAIRGLARDDTAEARLAIASRTYGLDVDAHAVLAARRAVWLLVGDPTLPTSHFDRNLVAGDALLEDTADGLVKRAWSDLLPGAPGTFDLVVMNPPFLGGKRLRTVLGERYAAALVRALPGTNGNADLSAHFLRRGFEVLSERGVLGAITTNTIAQGDTRAGGLSYLIERGAHVAAAERRVPWPGAAGVVTSLLWLTRMPPVGGPRLDGEAVRHIDALLSPLAREREAARLRTMRGRAFIGCFLRGRGFVFEDGPSGELHPRLHAALQARPGSAHRVAPFLGGEEVMTDVEHRARRHVIDFRGASRAEAAEDVELFALVTERVKPFRDARTSTPADRAHQASFWRFANHRPRLRAATRGLEHVIVIPRVTSQLVAVRLPNRFVFSDQLVIVASSSHAVLALLSSRVHAAWTTLLASTLGDGLRYTPSDVFETLPIPCATFEALESHAGLDAAGRAFEAARSRAQLDLGLGLTALMRGIARDLSAPFARLREHLVALDREVLAAYAFSDLDAGAWHEERGRPAFEPAMRSALLTRLFDRSMALAR